MDDSNETVSSIRVKTVARITETVAAFIEAVQVQDSWVPALSGELDMSSPSITKKLAPINN